MKSGFKEDMKKILIVEDDEAIRTTLRMALEMEGYFVVTSNNGEEGLRTLRAMSSPCLVLLDLMMPVMSGWDFLEAKKRDDHIATIPVLVTSAVADKVDPKTMAGIMKKPIDLDALLAFVKNFCASGNLPEIPS